MGWPVVVGRWLCSRFYPLWGCAEWLLLVPPQDYNAKHGGKWDLQNLRLFLEGSWGRDATTRLFDEIDNIIVHR